MRMFSEPESWVGLRSARAVAGEFEAPAAPRVARPRRQGGRGLALYVRSLMHRTLATLFGR